MFSDGATKLGSGVRADASPHVRGQHERHGHTHAGPLQDRRDAHPARERSHTQLKKIMKSVKIVNACFQVEIRSLNAFKEI